MITGRKFHEKDRKYLKALGFEGDDEKQSLSFNGLEINVKVNGDEAGPFLQVTVHDKDGHIRSYQDGFFGNVAELVKGAIDEFDEKFEEVRKAYEASRLMLLKMKYMEEK